MFVRAKFTFLCLNISFDATKCKLFVKNSSNAGCIFAYFCGRHKINFQLQFCSYFKGVLIDLCTHNFVYIKTTLCTQCMHSRHSALNLLSTFFYTKNIFLESIDFLENLEKTQIAGGERVMLFVSIWCNVYENWYVIYPQINL